jgi:uncharacterized membrane protein/protein-disulfide isomerase
LSTVALALSAYLGWHYLAGGSVIGCGGGSPCEQVLGSRWSTIGGVLPVGGLAAGAYLAMLVAILFIDPATEPSVRRLAWRAMLVLVGAAAGSAIWFTIVQKWVIGSFCPYCMATHITGVLLAVLVIWRAPAQLQECSNGVAPNATKGAVIGTPATNVSPAASWPVIPAWPVIGLALAGLMAVAQVAFPPAAVFRAGESQDDLPALDVRAVPLVGSPDAPYVVKLLFDYNCPHCQRLHAMLDEVIRRYGGQVAFALCPAPLNTHCNPYIPRDVDEFAASCELAKIALTVWVAKREAFAAFDRWMFSSDAGDSWHPRSLQTARAKAAELVGQAKFDATRSDPRIDQYLQTSVRIFGDTGGNAVPKLVLASHWVTPEPNDADDLVSILHESLGVPGP